MNKLIYRKNHNYEDIPHFVITKLGKVYKVFDSNYYSKTFGIPDYDKKIIKIAIENLGWLQRNSITGIYFNWIGDVVRTDPYIRYWRNYFFWDKYTNPQLVSLKLLVSELCEKHNIDNNCVKTQSVINNIELHNGIVFKCNLADIYTDINPSFDFNLL